MGCERSVLGVLVLGAALAGCGPSGPDADAVLAQALRQAPPEHVFRGRLGGQPVHLVAHDCAVYRADADGRGWTRVLAPDPYPFFTSCERQWLDADGEAVLATLGRRALGAGGCCATGGTYRSVDGRHWTPR